MELEIIDKIVISSVIGCSVIIFILLVYHRLKYYTSNYGKFEYYLTGESSFPGLLILSDIIFQAAFCIGLVFLLGYCVSLIIF